MSITNYKLNNNHKRLLRSEVIENRALIKDYIEKIIYKHVLIEKGSFFDKRDSLINKDLIENQLEYILNNKNFHFIIKRSYNGYFVLVKLSP